MPCYMTGIHHALWTKESTKNPQSSRRTLLAIITMTKHPNKPVISFARRRSRWRGKRWKCNNLLEFRLECMQVNQKRGAQKTHTRLICYDFKISMICCLGKELQWNEPCCYSNSHFSRNVAWIIGRFVSP